MEGEKKEYFKGTRAKYTEKQLQVAQRRSGNMEMFKDGPGGFEVCVVCLNNTPGFLNSAFNALSESEIPANNSQGVFPALPGSPGPGRKFQRQGLSVEIPAVRLFAGWKMLPRRRTPGSAAAGKSGE